MIDITIRVLQYSPSLLLKWLDKHFLGGEKMLRTKPFRIAAILIVTMWFLSASAGSQAKTAEVFEMVNPADEVNRFDSEISNAQKNQVNVLAPVSFSLSPRLRNTSMMPRKH